MYIADTFGANKTLVHRKVMAPAIGGGNKVYVEAKAHPFAKLANGDLLDTSDVCRLFGCSARTLYRWVAERQLKPRVKVGREYLFTKAELLRWSDERPHLGRPFEGY